MTIYKEYKCPYCQTKFVEEAEENDPIDKFLEEAGLAGAATCFDCYQKQMKSKVTSQISNPWTRH